MPGATERKGSRFLWMCSSACASPAGDWLDEQRRTAAALGALQLDHVELGLKLESKSNALKIALGQRDQLERELQARRERNAESALDSLADALEPGQGVVLGRTSVEQLAELAKLEISGAWAVTVMEPHPPDGAGVVQPDELTLFCDDDRAEAVRRARFYLDGKNGKRGTEP